MKKPFFNLCCVTAALLLAAGCVTEPEVRKYKLQMGIPHGSKKYTPVNPAGLRLGLISKPVLYAGEESILTFSLKNSGTGSVNIEEWFRHEPDNLILYVQPYMPGMSSPDPEAWFEISEPLKKPVLHYPVTLMPDNQMLISKKLTFISKMSVSPGKERRFFLKAALTLDSLKLESDTIVLRVFPAQNKGVPRK